MEMLALRHRRRYLQLRHENGRASISPRPWRCWPIERDQAAKARPRPSPAAAAGSPLSRDRAGGVDKQSCTGGRLGRASIPRMPAPRRPRPSRRESISASGNLAREHRAVPTRLPPLDRQWILSRPAEAPAGKILETIGDLRRSSASGSLYDMFRGRGLFSIHDVQGRPVGMGGRLLPGRRGLPSRKIRQLAGNAAVPQEPSALRSRSGQRGHPQEQDQDRPGDGGLHGRHRRPPVRLQQCRGHAGRRLGRKAISGS